MISFVNSTAYNNPSGAHSAVTAALSTTTGNSLVVFIGNEVSGTPAAVNSVVDTAGNSYALVGDVGIGTGATSSRQECWVAHNITGHASNVITVTYSNAAYNRTICALQYSGLDVNSFAGSSFLKTSTGKTHTTTEIATTAVPQIYLGHFLVNVGTSALVVVSPAVSRAASGSGASGVAVIEKEASTEGSYSVSMSTVANASVTMLAATFKEASGAPPIALAGSSSGSSTVTLPALATSIRLSAGTLGSSVVSGVMSTPAPAELVGSVSGGSSTASTLSTTIKLAASTVANAIIAGSLSTIITVSSVASGYATVASGNLATTIKVFGTTSGNSAVTGALYTSTSSAVAGSAYGSSTATGSLAASIRLAGAPAGSSLLSGPLSTVIALVGDAAGQAEISCFLQVDKPLIGLVSGSATVSSNLFSEIYLSGLGAGSTVITGGLFSSIFLVGGVVRGITTVTGRLTVTPLPIRVVMTSFTTRPFQQNYRTSAEQATFTTTPISRSFFMK